MHVEPSTVTKLYITDVPRLDPITVFLEDFGQNRGKLIIECYGKSWSTYWGSMGTNLVNFIKQANSDYIASKMFHGEIQIYDKDGLEQQLKKEVLHQRWKNNLSSDEAKHLWHQIETSDFEHPFHLDSTMMVDLIGDDWHACLPYKTNPDFTYLVSIIDVVRQAVEQLYPET